MSDNSSERSTADAKNWQFVLKEERLAFGDRRRNAGFNDGPLVEKGDAGSQGVEDDVVGLALSGGGVRSAAFSLGVIQAFHRFGLLRFIDVVSAVSGGTYAAAMLTKALNKDKFYNCTQAPIAVKSPAGSPPSDDKGASDTFALAQDVTGRSSSFVRSVSARGNYLYRADLFLRGFVPGALLNLVPRLALLIAFGSGIAFLWRVFDFHGARDYFNAYGFQNDYIPALAPPFFVALLWALSLILCRPLRLRPRLPTFLMWATIASFAISIAVLVGNGDVTLEESNLSSTLEERRLVWLNDLWKLFVATVGVGCLPLLFPKELVRSGVSPSHWMQSWIFYYVSLAVFLGVPLASVAWFAREDVSGFNRYRGPEILPGDVKNDFAFHRLISGRINGTEVIRLGGVVVKVEIPGRLVESIDGPVAALLSSKSFRTFWSFFPVKLPRSQESIHRNLEDKYDALLVENEFPNDRQRNSDGAESKTTSTPNADVLPNGATMSDWLNWRYRGYRLCTTLTQFIPYLLHDVWTKDEDDWTDFDGAVQDSKTVRDARDACLLKVNRQLSKEPFFSFELDSNADDDRTAANASPRLIETLELIRQSGSQTTDGVVPLLLDETNLADINRLLLEEAYPQLFRRREEIRRANVIEFDQWHRMIWFFLSISVALIFGWIINPNRTSLHGYYRDRLAAAYLGQDKDGHGERLSQVWTHKQGLPYLMFNAAAAPAGRWSIADSLEPDLAPYLLSPLFLGNPKRKFYRTSEFDHSNSDALLTVPDAMAVSGAALAPSFFVHHAVRLLLNMLNFRTGQLLPNPGSGARDTRISMLSEFMDSFHRGPDSQRFITLTDGGHVENLGIEPLLLRRCKLIVLCDVGHDPDHGLDDLARVLRRLEAEQGIRISELVPDRNVDPNSADGFPVRIPADMADPVNGEKPNGRLESLDRLFKGPSRRRHFFVARIIYPECGAEKKNGTSMLPDFEGRLIYIKPCLTGDEGIRIYNYARRNPAFPHEPTLDQAFSEEQFEAYRSLGFHSGVDVCSHYTDPFTKEPAGESLWQMTHFQVRTLLDPLVTADVDSKTQHLPSQMAPVQIPTNSKQSSPKQSSPKQKSPKQKSPKQKSPKGKPKT